MANEPSQEVNKGPEIRDVPHTRQAAPSEEETVPLEPTVFEPSQAVNKELEIRDTPDTGQAASEEEVVTLEPHWGKLIKIAPSGSQTVLLKEESYTGGRSPSCQLIITEADVSAENFIQISKVHFRIQRNVIEDKHFAILEDLSSNGTFVDNKKIGKRKQILLTNSAEISLIKPSLKLFVYMDASRSSLDDWFDGQNQSKWIDDTVTNRYLVFKTLGSGTYGEVKLVFDQRTNERHAMKKILKSKMATNKIFNEINILRRLQHPGIIHLEDVFETPEAVFIKLEYISGGNLLDRIRTLRRLPEKETKGTFYQLLMGVQYLHREGVTHRDLKPENILVQPVPGSDYILVKITDFGLSKVIDSSATFLKTICGTVKYMAPEVLTLSNSSYDNKVDIWSLGVILFVCLSGRHPFAQEDRPPVNSQILKGCLKFKRDLWKDISIQAMYAIKKILIVDPVRRISLAQLFSHNWLKDEEMKNEINYIISEKSIEDLEPVLKKQKFM